MRFSRHDIKTELLDNWEQISNHIYPEDLIRQYADEYLPIYYCDILAEWQQMPSEYDDRWQEMTPDANGKRIFDLMSIDLWIYYQDLALEVYNEILEEQTKWNYSQHSLSLSA